MAGGAAAAAVAITAAAARREVVSCRLSLSPVTRSISTSLQFLIFNVSFFVTSNLFFISIFASSTAFYNFPLKRVEEFDATKTLFRDEENNLLNVLKCNKLLFIS